MADSSTIQNQMAFQWQCASMGDKGGGRGPHLCTWARRPPPPCTMPGASSRGASRGRHDTSVTRSALMSTLSMAIGHSSPMPKTLPRPSGNGLDNALGQGQCLLSARISPQNGAHPAAPLPVSKLALMLVRPPRIIATATWVKGGQRWRSGATFGCSGGGGSGGGGEGVPVRENILGEVW
jgi:hypothetical protein